MSLETWRPEEAMQTELSQNLEFRSQGSASEKLYELHINCLNLGMHMLKPENKEFIRKMPIIIKNRY